MAYREIERINRRERGGGAEGRREERAYVSEVYQDRGVNERFVIRNFCKKCAEGPFPEEMVCDEAADESFPEEMTVDKSADEPFPKE